MAKRKYYYQQGSTPDLKVTDENKWYVSYEDWQGNRVLNRGVVSRHDTEAEAIQKRKELKAQK